MKKNILSVKFILVSIAFSFLFPNYISAQIKVQNSGRVGIGLPSSFYSLMNIPQISTTDRLTINASGEDRAILVNYDHDRDWYQSVCVRNSKKETGNYVVSLWDAGLNSFIDNFWVDGAGVEANHGSWNMSDAKLKYNVKQILSPLDKVKLLNGVTYNLISEKGTSDEKRPYIGFIAQEVEKVVPEAVREFHTGLKGINYASMVSLMAEAIKEQQKEIEGKDQQIKKIEEDLAAIKATLQNCCSGYLRTSGNSTAIVQQQAFLKQNAPNPFNTRTKIEYFVSEKSINNCISIYNTEGKKIIDFKEVEKGLGYVEVNAQALKSGTYVYNLVSDGVQVDSKIMIVTE
jgi:hypothetical protein